MIKFIYLRNLWFDVVFVLLLSLLGCKENNIENAQSIFQAGGEKMIATPQVEHAMKALLALEKNMERHRAMEASHQEWLKLRKTHCAAMINTDSTETNQKLSECYEAFDNQRIAMLNQQRISLLIDLPPKSSIPNYPINITYSPETKFRPTVPLSLVIASSAPVAAVTFASNMTEIFDLTNGQLLSRIQTLDDDMRRGVYHFFLTPNGRILIASYHWPKTGLRMWDTLNGEMLRDKMISPYYDRFPMKNGKYFIYTERNRMGIYDIVTDKSIWYFDGKRAASYMALSPDDKWLIVGREEQIECWELIRSEDNQISYTLRQVQTAGNYFYQPSSIVFPSSSRFFYGSLPKGFLLKWQLPDLTLLERVRLSRFKDIRIIQIPGAESFLMEASVSNSIMEAYVVNVTEKRAQHLTEHTGRNSKIAPINSNLILLATPFELRVLKLPNTDDMRPASQSLGEILYEPVPVTRGIQTNQLQHIQTDCTSAQIEAIGVYEGSLQTGRRGFQEKIPGHVVVNIGATDKPVKLVLSSYEPVIWQLKEDLGARLSEILLSGSNESRIEGISKINITYIGSAYSYGNSKRGRNVFGLENAVKQKTGCGIENFQGSYTGNNFYIGKQSTTTNSGRHKVYKHTDKDGSEVYQNY